MKNKFAILCNFAGIQDLFEQLSNLVFLCLSMQRKLTNLDKELKQIIFMSGMWRKLTHLDKESKQRFSFFCSF